MNAESIAAMRGKLEKWTDPTKLEELGLALLNEPITRRFVQKSSLGDNTIHEPEDVLGERLLRLGGTLLIEAKAPGEIRLNFKDDDRAAALIALVHTSLEASPYLITEVVRNQMRSIDIPRHTLSPRLLPEPRMWLTLETGVSVGEGVHFDYFVLADAGDRFLLTSAGEMDSEDMKIRAPGGRSLGRPFIETHSYEYGKVYPDDFGDFDPPMRGEAGELHSILALLAFLNSPYIPKERRRPSRAARRESQRSGSNAAEQEVSFIILRRPERHHHDATGEESEVEWKHRWIVSGHMRAQWYPSEQAHRLIWIAPYMKGPEEAPLLEHVYKVAQ